MEFNPIVAAAQRRKLSHVNRTSRSLEIDLMQRAKSDPDQGFHQCDTVNPIKTYMGSEVCRSCHLEHYDAIFDGAVPLDHVREDHPAWLARPEREGRLRAELVRERSVPLRILYFGVGYALIGLGLFLLVFAVINFTALILF